MNDVNGFTEDHHHINSKILWTSFFCLVGFCGWLYEKVYGWDDAKLALIISSAIYLIGYNSYYLYGLYFAQSTFYQGNRGGKIVWLSSKLVTPEAIYELDVLSPQPSGPAKSVNKFKTSIGNWVTEDGFIDVQAMTDDLQKVKMATAKAD